MLDIQKRFGQRIKHLRISKNLTQDELAEKAELHHTYIGNVEQGRSNITLKNIVKLAEVLEINISELFIDFNNENQDEILALISNVNDKKTCGMLVKIIKAVLERDGIKKTDKG